MIFRICANHFTDTNDEKIKINILKTYNIQNGI